jgi:hypothetical protein
LKDILAGDAFAVEIQLLKEALGIKLDTDERGGARILPIPKVVQTAETQSAQRFSVWWRGV